VGGREAFLKYEKIGEGVIDFKMLYVPKNLRGVGIAEKVLKRAIGFVEKNNFKVKSSCNYINHFLESHPEFQTIVSERPDMFTWVLHYN
jgi:predicted GNAT family acetyltransferase